MIYRRFNRFIAEAQRQNRLHSGRARGVQLGDYVGNKNYIRRGPSQFFSDPPVAVLINFVADGGIEVTIDVVGEIARSRMAEQESLRQFAARRIDANKFALTAPALESRRDVVKDLAEQPTRLITLPPDSPLNRF